MNGFRRSVFAMFILGLGSLGFVLAQNYPLPTGVGVRALAWNPDYTLLAAANPEGLVWLYTAEGELFGTLPAGYDHVTSVAWSRDGKYLACGTLKGEFMIWETETWKLEQAVRAFFDGVFQVSWNADGSRFAASGFDTFQVWDTSTWQPLTKGLSVTLYALDWHPSDRELFAYATSRFSGIHRFDGSVVTGFQGPLDPPPFEQVETLTWSADAGLVAVAGHDWIHVWRSEDGTAAATVEVQGEDIRRLSFITGDGTILAAVADSGSVYTVDIAASLAERVTTIEGTPLAAAWNPVSQTLWIGGVANREDDSPENVIRIRLDAEDLGIPVILPAE